MKQITPEEFNKLKGNKASRFTGVVVSKLMGWKRYYLKGKLHRMDGPAMETETGHCEWWWHGTIIYMTNIVYTAPDINLGFYKSKTIENLDYIELDVVKGNNRPGLDQIYFRKILCEDGILYIPILPGM